MYKLTCLATPECYSTDQYTLHNWKSIQPSRSQLWSFSYRRFHVQVLLLLGDSLPTLCPVPQPVPLWLLGGLWLSRRHTNYAPPSGTTLGPDGCTSVSVPNYQAIIDTRIGTSAKTNQMTSLSTIPILKATWTKATDKHLMDKMAAQSRKGKKLHNSFKKKVSQEIMDWFNKKVRNEKVKTVKQLKMRAYNVSW